MPLMSVRMWRLCSLLSCAAGQMTPGSQVVAELRAAIAAHEDNFALPAGGIEFPDGAGLSLSLSLSLSHSLSLSLDGTDFLILGAKDMTISAAETGATATFPFPAID
eukprot:COSAG03_NODE_1673_length_3668_cov_55.647718_2_plen_107_part_00